TQVSGTVHGGTYSAKQQAGTSKLQQNLGGITAGETYTITYYFLDNDPNAKCRPWAYWLNGTTTLTDNATELRPSTYSTDNANWVEYTYTLVAPATADGFRFEVRTYNDNAGGGFVYYDDFSVTGGGAVTPTILKAYAISATAVDVEYNVAVTTAIAGSYALTGSAAITFSGATIDGDPTIVHLTGASSNMTGDNTLDNLADAANSTDFDFYAGITPISFTNSANPGGTLDNVHPATFTGIVSANDVYNNVWVSDAAGAYHGNMIYDNNFDGLVAVGDNILLSGIYSPYNNLSELVNPVLISTISTGNTPYGPSVINGSAIAETIPANTNPGEQWEGQLVKIENFTVASYDAATFQYRCSWSDGTNTFYFYVGDNVDYHLLNVILNVGQTYASITGVVDWFYSGPYYRINPRNQADVSASAAATARIVGSMQGWNTTDPDYVMSLNANGVYELTKSLDAGDYEYKVVEGDTWSDPNYPSNNQHVILSATENVTWKANIDAELVTHLLPVVAGDFISELGGTDWLPTDLIGEMSDPEGDDIYTLEVTIPAGNYEAKVALNQNWNQSTGGNVPFITDGITPTIFTYDFPNNTTTISGPPPPTDLVTFIVDDAAGMNYDGFALKGSWDANGQYDPSWGGGAEHSVFYDDGTNGDAVAGDHIWTCQQELVVDGGTNSWEWGINDTEGNWIAGNWGFTVPDQTPQTLSWTVPATPALVINEIMYNSTGSDEEWIELYNNTDQPMSLENWKLLDNDAAHTPITIPAGYSIDAYGYFTIEVATSGAFPFTPDYDGSGNFNFTNTTDVVRLYNADGILIDNVSFGDSDPWPSSPDGNGPSLSLFHPDLDNALPESWRGSNEDGGTPGSINFPINIVTPNGGETIDQGSSYDITWTVEGWDGSVDINLVREGQNPVLLVSNLAVSVQSFTWNVFTTVEPATDYKILISETTGGNPFDLSDDFFTVNEVTVVPEIVITEIMYNPPESGNDSLEFIELYNNGVDAVDLEGFYFSKGVDYTFPAMTLLPDSYQVIGINSAAMLSTFGVVAEQWTGGALSNSGEEIELSDSFGNIVDNVLFSDALPWDTLADGYGPSLTLCNPNTDNSVPENWTHSIHYVGVNASGDSIWATPGMGCDNSIFVDFEGTPTTVGMGGSVVFTDLSFGDVTQWTWTFDGGTPATWDGQTPPGIIYNAEGTYDVTLSITDGINVEELTKLDYITVIDLPAPTNLLAEVGPFDDVTLSWTSPSVELLGFNVYRDDVQINTALVTETTYNDPMPAIGTHDYYVTSVYTEGESGPSNVVTILITGISDNQSGSVSVYPNPTDGLFTINMPGITDAVIMVTDITGKVVYNETAVSGAEINLTGLEKGLYFVQIQDQMSKQSLVKKLLVY
ncbi:MAG: lamin tail domain-containing protein, partial [Bacteroidales bacterium]